VDQDQRRDVLRGAEEEVRRLGRAHGWDSPQASAARRRRLELERSTAAELGLPYAEQIDLGVNWGTDTPVPILLSGLRTFVVFYLRSREADPFVRDPPTDLGIGIVEFKQVTSVKIGSVKDEALRGHPLWGSGLEHCRAHQVRNSRWIIELMNMHRVPQHFDEGRWSGARHYVLTFRDETFECVARRTVTRTATDATMGEVITRLSRELL
jgi:hypothetical protein